VNTAVIVAGGSGERLGVPGGKQLAVVAGRPVLAHTLAAFSRCDAIDEIVVVVHPDRIGEYRTSAIDPTDSPKIRAVVGGGLTRQDSVAAGIAAISTATRVIVVHDGARPLVTPELITDAIEALGTDPALGGVVVGHPSYDTLKWVDADGRITGTPDRGVLWAAQTPQVFRAEVLRQAYATAAEGGYSGTDDASLVEHTGWPVRMIAGPRDNIKVTVPEDVLIVERVLEARGYR